MSEPVNPQTKLAFVVRILQTQLDYIKHYETRCHFLLVYYAGFSAFMTFFVMNQNPLTPTIRGIYSIIMVGVFFGILLLLWAITPTSRPSGTKGFSMTAQEQKEKDITFYQGVRQYETMNEYSDAVIQMCSEDINTLIIQFAHQNYIVSGILKKNVELFSFSTRIAMGTTCVSIIIVILGCLFC